MRREAKYNNLNVFRSNTLIQQSSNFTLLEQKIILTAIAQHRKSDEDFFEYTFGITELAELFGVEAKNLYMPVKNVCKSLIGRSIGYINDNNKELELHALMSTVSYKEGFLHLRFNTDLKGLLLEIGEQYTFFQLKTVVKLKGKHSIRLYELIMMGKNKYNGRGYWEMDFGSLEGIKDLLGLYTIPNKTKGEKKYRYPNFPELNRKVLKPAIKEINEFTDISITMDSKTKSQKTINVIFHAKRKENKLPKIKTKVAREDIEFFYSKLSEEEKKTVDADVNESLTVEPPIDFMEEFTRISLREKLSKKILDKAK